MHLVFYDGECGFCDNIVQFLLKHDTHKKFIFAPLQGLTAEKLLSKEYPQYKELKTLVLVEDYSTEEQKTYTEGKASFRILWLLGGFWSFIGWINFLPSFLYNFGYRIVANNRSFLSGLFFRKECKINSRDDQARFLP